MIDLPSLTVGLVAGALFMACLWPVITKDKQDKREQELKTRLGILEGKVTEMDAQCRARGHQRKEWQSKPYNRGPRR